MGKDSEPEQFTLFGAKFSGYTLVDHPAAADARQRILRSAIAAGVALAVLLVFAFWEAPSTQSVSSTVGFALLFAYGVWATYWGFVGMIDRAADLSADKVAHAGVDGVALALVIGIFYGILGGGVYQFFKHRKIAKGAIPS